jgi:hypothetical protein
LAEWTGLAADAAACAAAAGQAERAIEMLEQGRSVLWTQVPHMRSDLTRLIEHHHDLAARLDEVRRELDRPLPDTTPAELDSPTGRGLFSTGRAAQEHTLESGVAWPGSGTTSSRRCVAWSVSSTSSRRRRSQT